MPAEEVSLAVRQALRDARARRIRGQEVTPFLLERVRRLTRGDSLRANIGLLLNNAAVAAQISKIL
jgi:pseudouridine-5'-phosphate glycosidase